MHSVLRFVVIVSLFGLVAGCVSTRSSRNLGFTESQCTFDLGYQMGLRRAVYDNSCPAETEAHFLDGYRIGRKMSWIDADLASADHKLKCLRREYDLRFSGTLSPIVISLSSEDSDKVKKELTQMGCSSDTVRTTWGMQQDIQNAKNILPPILEKRQRLENLHNDIVQSPNKTQELLAQYRAAGADDLDADLKWKDYVMKKGGLDNLSGTEQGLVYKEVLKMPEMSKEAALGSVYGFGIGHSVQKRFWKDGWKWAVIDSLVAGTLIYGASTGQNGVILPAAVFGIPLSRAFQYVGVYTYHMNHNIDLEELRTEHSQKPFLLSWQLSW